VFVIVNKYHESTRYYESATVQLPAANCYTPDFITAAKKAVEKIFKPNVIYRKAGVILTELIPQEFMQLNWYLPSADAQKQTATMETVDAANDAWGKDTVTFAAAGTEKPWKTKSEKKSANFTTSWHEILTIKV
jgi:DNA polymerase V